jgi:hypothetical protein
MKWAALNATTMRKESPGAINPCLALSLPLCALLARSQSAYKPLLEGLDAG